MLKMAAFDREKINQQTFLRPFCDCVNFCLTILSKTFKNYDFPIRANGGTFGHSDAIFGIRKFMIFFRFFEIFLVKNFFEDENNLSLFFWLAKT